MNDMTNFMTDGDERITIIVPSPTRLLWKFIDKYVGKGFGGKQYQKPEISATGVIFQNCSK